MADEPKKRRKKAQPEADAEVPSEPTPVKTPPRSKRDKKSSKSDDAGESSVPMKEQRKRNQKQDSSSSDSEDSSSSDHVVIEMQSEKSKKSKKSEKSTSSSAPKKSLAQSRKWDQEDLEVIVPDEELSDEEAQSGGHNHGPEYMESEISTMTDDEKSRLNWLTGVMPDEILRKIMWNLDEPVVDKTALLCHRTNDLLQQTEFWAPYKESWIYISPDTFSQAHSRRAFAKLYNSEMKQRHDTKVRAEQAAYARKLEEQSEWAKGWMMLFLFNRSADYLSLFCFILGTCFAAARSQEAILWSWRLVLLPFYIPMFQLILTPLVYDLCRRHYTSRNIDEITDNFILWHILFASHRPYRPVLYLNNLCLLTFWILLMVKLDDGYDAIPAGVVILPWLILLLGIALEQMFGWSSGVTFWDGRVLDRLFLLLSSIQIAIILLFVVIKLDNVVSWNWYKVLIPLWVYFGFLLIYPFIATTCAGCSYSARRNLRLADAEGACFAFSAHMWCIAFLAAPILTWFILAALNLDGNAHRSWAVVFIPIFIIDGLLIIACGVFDLIAFFDR